MVSDTAGCPSKPQLRTLYLEVTARLRSTSALRAFYSPQEARTEPEIRSATLASAGPRNSASMLFSNPRWVKEDMEKGMHCLAAKVTA